MELIKFGYFTFVVLASAVWLSRLLGSTARTQDGSHRAGPADIDSV